MDNFSIIKRGVITSVLFLVTICGVSAQDMTTYFMPNVIERQSFNASFAPERGYFNVPLIGSTRTTSNGNVALSDIIYQVDGENVFLLDTGVSASEAMSGLNSMNYVGLDSKLTLLGFGSYMADKKSFWSFDLSLRSSGNFSAPYELFDFIKTAPESATINSASEFYLESYIEAAFGYSRPIDDKLTVGARVKLLAGLMNASLSIEQMNVSMGSDEWMVQAKGYLDINAKGTTVDSSIDDTNMLFEFGDLSTSVEGISGFGAAIDLGATYDYTDRIHFSASANDIGFISWSEGGNLSASLSDEFSFTGAKVDIDDSGVSLDDESTVIDFDELEFVNEGSKSSTKWLQGSINLGAEYDLMPDLLSVGAVYTTKFWRTETSHNLTTAVTCCPLDWLTVAASYAFTNSGSNSFGCAANIATGFVNLFVSTDVLLAKKSAQLIPVNQTMMNVSFGVAVPLARRGER